MTRKNLACMALVVGLVWAVGSCEPPLSINENPNAPEDVSPAVLLPQSIQAGVSQALGGYLMLVHTSVWSYHVVELQYPDEEQGLVRPARMDIYWNNFYAGPLRDIETAIAKGAEAQDVNIQAVGRIWKSWIFHIVTDLWGDVPYSEALKGAENTAPPYDAQADVYAGLLAELTAAAQALENPAASDVYPNGFGAGDLIYGNDYELWRRFANSLRMRLAMRLSEVDLTTAQSEFVAAYNAGGFESNVDNAMLRWPGSPYENPFYENYLVRDDTGISGALVDTLKNLSDPRLPLYAEPAEIDGEYRGHQNGWDDLPEGQSLAWFSRQGNFWRRDGAATPTMIMTYSEVLFLQAEAAERGWIGGDPAALYTEGIQANMNQYDEFGVGPTDTEITTYLAQPEVAYNGLNSIYVQKWISLYMNGSESWADQRRTDYPYNTPGRDLLLTQIPTRFHYPPIEQSLNEANWSAAVTNMGGSDDLVTRVWWDVAYPVAPN
ncbi:MAG: SusD/RagB family nutrient-binding outer membrane lipoprotein [Gemmatimonadetes bacterium]|nr:SusD/RagB family nutrient-binding outer membrane lipoprotein [Gemmatimonadota bacterium]NIO33269.1 SusD/RagB family nutrient-binding outer membrane lipoprotein [Gemmatimonadota bacterium]